MHKAKDKKKKTAYIQVRTTPEQQNKWQEKANLAGLSLSEYIRQTADENDIASDEFNKERKQLLYEINRVGVNLNQIAKWANTHLDDVKSDEVVGILNEISDHTSKIGRSLFATEKIDAD